MGSKLTDLLTEIEAEAEAAGPEALAELDALRAQYQLARELIELRRAKNMTQSRLAELSGVGQSEISRIESGRANPTVATLGALARPLGATMHMKARD